MWLCRPQDIFRLHDPPVIPHYIFREFEDNGSLDGSLENMERGSIASFGSGNTTDSDHLIHLASSDNKVSWLKEGRL